MLVFASVLLVSTKTSGSPAVFSMNTGQNCDGSLTYNFSFNQNQCYVAVFCQWPQPSNSSTASQCPQYRSCAAAGDWAAVTQCLTSSSSSSYANRTAADTSTAFCNYVDTSFMVSSTWGGMLSINFYDNSKNCSVSAAGGMTAGSTFQNDYCFWSSSSNNFWSWWPVSSLLTCGVRSWQTSSPAPEVLLASSSDRPGPLR